MTEIISNIFIAVGTLFNLLSCIGLIRLPDTYNRLQASTKALTLGLCSILLGVTIRYGFTGIGIKAILAIVVIFFTATVSAHALARGTHRFGIRPGDETIRDDYREKNNGPKDEKARD